MLPDNYVPIYFLAQKKMGHLLVLRLIQRLYAIAGRKEASFPSLSKHKTLAQHLLLVMSKGGAGNVAVGAYALPRAPGILSTE